MAMSPATRRELLRLSAALSTVGAASSVFGLQLAAMGEAAAQQASDYRALVCIFLYGGNDSNNTVLATDTDSWNRYWAARNTGNDPIALMPVGTPVTAVGAISPVTGRTARRDSPENWGGVLPITLAVPNPVPPGTSATERTIALNPFLAPLVPIWDAGRLAIAANVGPLIQPTTKDQYRARSVPLPANLMSHNDQQSTWQAGAAEGARRGWGGLMIDQLLSGNGTNAVFSAISTAGNAVFLSGRDVVQYQVTTAATPAVRITPAVATTLFSSATGPSRLAEIIRDTGGANYFGVDHAARVVRSMDSATTLNDSFTAAAVTAIPAPAQIVNPVTGASETNQLAVQLQTIARLIAANATLGLRRQVFFVSLGGWDNHDVQNSTQSVLLNRVGHAMSYFDGVLANIGGIDMRSLVTTFTASDFSRTFTTNGDGTDHAWGAHHFIMGGAVSGRRIYGQYPTLGVDQGSFSNPNMSGNILIPQMSVDQLGATLGAWLGVSDSALLSIFPNLANFTQRNLAFV
ncbi:MAG: DUF1501 domain-containing protein [Hyphomonadaceae bacterium]|nr:DUF1501 domain-containing protein [Hyphomonadaceae bacterium]